MAKKERVVDGKSKYVGGCRDTRGESEYCPAAVVTDETGWWVEDWTRREERASQRGH